jgi:hypothetical protein
MSKECFNCKFYTTLGYESGECSIGMHKPWLFGLIPFFTGTDAMHFVGHSCEKWEKYIKRKEVK